MTSRRLVLAALILAALGAAWWLHSDGLSAEERRLVGTWRHRDVESGDWFVIELGPDRSYRAFRRSTWTNPDAITGRWVARDGILLVDAETQAVRRVARPLAGLFGLSVQAVRRRQVAWSTGNELIVTDPRDERLYTRAPAD